VGSTDGRFRGSPSAAVKMLLAKAHVADVPGLPNWNSSTRRLVEMIIHNIDNNLIRFDNGMSLNISFAYTHAYNTSF
jgi:hypothetical protein